MKRIMDFFGLSDPEDEMIREEEPTNRGGRHVGVLGNSQGDNGGRPLEVVGSQGPQGLGRPVVSPVGAPQRPAPYTVVPSNQAPVRGEHGASGMGGVARMGASASRASEGKCNSVGVIRPKQFRDASEVADCLLANQPVIVNLEVANNELTRRMIDFCAGVAYALQGTMEKVAEQVFLLRPPGVEVSGERRGTYSSRDRNTETTRS